MKNFFHRHVLLRKIAVTLLFIFLFIGGRHLTLPTVKLLVDNELLSLDAGQLSNYGLFGLGLGPWMYAMIISRIFSPANRRQMSSERKRSRRRNTILLLISTIQALGLLVNLGIDATKVNLPVFLIESTLIMVAGSYILSWFANMNAEYGIGNSIALVLVSLLLPQLSMLPNFFEAFKTGHTLVAIFLLLWSLFCIYVMSLLDKAEYRLKLKRISINNSMADDSYLPLRVNSAGGLPMMYAYTLLTFPQYVIMLLQYAYPRLDLSKWSSYFSVTSWQGILIYALVIYLLAISFAFFNVDTYYTTEGLRNSGDYFPNIRPGRPTQKFLSRIVWQLSLFSGLILMICVTLPLILGLTNEVLQGIAPTTGILMMISGMMLTIRQEIKMYRLKSGYNSIF